MKSLLFFALVFQALYAFSSAAIPSLCSEKPESGICMAYFPRYFYNSTSGECEHFVYGGCQGNENNFQTLNECEQTCTDICLLPKEPGLCLGYFQNYYYNAESGSCEMFVYGGCMGNRNNFETLEDCETHCP
ncbi:PI-stichotoxin-Hcr2e-like [Dendronephthya gigantea]|uniref:PI-stichotoxin-Hcr2e-like n=1 Tax=Dendronephthya gigantea TaxID=151771 RepID=UPI001068E385|nr:PI-stichotoxin-Hcr2e-like [Dendronephthya gigantea]